VFLVADGLALLISGRIISGLSAGVFTGTATATLVDLAAPERRARATLAATVANIGGLGCGALLAGVLSEWAGSPLRLTFCVDLALLVPAALGIQTMPEPVVPRSGLRLRPQGLRLPAEMRATFAQAAVAAFAPAFLGQTLGVTNRAAVGLVVLVVFAASTVGQASLQFVRERLALPAGCMVLIAGMGFLALALWLSSLTLLVLGAVVAGFGQGLSFRAGLAELNARSPAERRAAVASSFFVVMYLALALPVIGEGVLTQLVGLRAAGLTFAAVVAALAAVALLLLWRGSQHEERVRLPLAHGHKPSTA
jgi:predicted MFS family arabinose efflux permease